MSTTIPAFCCPKCEKRVPKNRPILICSICSDLKHYSCNKLSKNEAISIIESGFLKYWTCQECTRDIFPNFECTRDIFPKSFDNKTRKISTIKNAHNPAVICTVCSKACSSCSTSKCGWCDNLTHANSNCTRKSLGCLNCCNNMIPDYNYHAYEITNRFTSTLNDSTAFNPYDLNLLANQIGTSPGEDDDSTTYNEISEKLKKCKYSEAKNVKLS